ncbi:MAG: TIGR01777 family oxidoreductase [Crocinitomicaceae bacterium]
MTILIAGGTGLIGKRLTALLIAKGHDVHILTRQDKSNSKSIFYFKWIVGKSIDTKAFFKHNSNEVVDGIINLTGAGIADKRWSDSRKQEIISSRVEPARFIQRTLLDLKLKVPVYISASGSNYYNNSEKKKFVESDSVGDNYVQQVCDLWEKQAFKMKNVADRIAVMRTGVVLAKKGSFLQKFTATTVIGVAGIFGSGHQFLSWIHIDDLCNFYIKTIEDSKISGAYNVGISENESHLSFIKSFRIATGKKFLIAKAPVFIAKLVFGEMSTLLTDGVAISHNKMLKTGFELEYNTVEKAVKDLVI